MTSGKRVLLFSDMAHTGFGRVGRELAAGLLGLGYDVRVVAINWRGVDGEIVAAMHEGAWESQAKEIEAKVAELRADPLVDRLYPAGAQGDALGYNLTAAAVGGVLWRGWVPEAVILVADPRAAFHRLLRDGGALRKAASKGVPVLNYVPIEGINQPRDYAAIWDFVRPVAMTAFGAAVIDDMLGRKDTPVVYHGVSPAFFRVSEDRPGAWQGRPIRSKAEAKEAWGFEGKRVVLRTDRFVQRKQYPAFFRVMRPILSDSPDVLAVVHTVPIDDRGEGSIWQLISREEGAERGELTRYGEFEWKHPQIVLTNRHDSWVGLTDDELNVLVNAADVTLSTSMGEGFGLTLAESLACGVPVVATDYSAMTEVVARGGILTRPRGLFTSGYASDWAIPDEELMTVAVRRLLEDPELRGELGKDGLDHVAGFTWSAMTDAFDGLLKAEWAKGDKTHGRNRLPVSAGQPGVKQR